MARVEKNQPHAEQHLPHVDLLANSETLKKAKPVKQQVEPKACGYKHILVGLGLSEDSLKVLQKAELIANLSNAKLSLVHVIEPVAFAYGGDLPLDVAEIEAQQIRKAQQDLQSLIKQINFPVHQEHVLVGQAATELHFLAQEENVDLIIIGSHERKGFALLLSSTSNNVLQGARCDVLAVHIENTHKH